VALARPRGRTPATSAPATASGRRACLWSTTRSARPRGETEVGRASGETKRLAGCVAIHSGWGMRGWVARASAADEKTGRGDAREVDLLRSISLNAILRQSCNGRSPYLAGCGAGQYASGCWYVGDGGGSGGTGRGGGGGGGDGNGAYDLRGSYSSVGACRARSRLLLRWAERRACFSACLSTRRRAWRSSSATAVAALAVARSEDSSSSIAPGDPRASAPQAGPQRGGLCCWARVRGG
jgi:hypothetical protein